MGAVKNGGGKKVSDGVQNYSFGFRNHHLQLDHYLKNNVSVQSPLPGRACLERSRRGEGYAKRGVNKYKTTYAFVRLGNYWMLISNLYFIQGVTHNGK